MDTLLNTMGIIQIEGIVQARAKKPVAVGRYLRQNTRGVIDTWAMFDGDEFGEPVQCETGKIYSVGGVNYQFNGSTCTVIGTAAENNLGTPAPTTKNSKKK